MKDRPQERVSLSVEIRNLICSGQHIRTNPQCQYFFGDVPANYSHSSTSMRKSGPCFVYLEWLSLARKGLAPQHRGMEIAAAGVSFLLRP